MRTNASRLSWLGIIALTATALLGACGTDSSADGPVASTNPDIQPDTGTADAGKLDTALPVDTAVVDAAAPLDTATSDDTGAALDIAATDIVATTDTGAPSDSGIAPDAGPADTGAPECATAADCKGATPPCVIATCTAGKCGLLNADKGTACDDGNACTAPDACDGGVCLPGPATACNDANSCTVDSCDKAGGCANTPVSVPCNDGDKCTLADQCDGGLCKAGATAGCDDSNPCTDDSCEPLAGCVHKANEAGCDDSNACTIGDTCSAKACLPGQVTACDDSNPCTNDSCDAQSGCGHTPNKLPCADGDTCTTKDTCDGGQCKGGAALNCDDTNPCTDDTCDPQAGCKNAHNTKDCDDGSLCTDKDTCNAGKCEGGAAKTCSDGNPCTTDACDPATGCTFKLNSGTCDDGNACTDFDLCNKGKCKGVAKDPKTDCDDNNPCTTDGCEPGSSGQKGAGCTHSINTAACDDGNACSQGDACKDGKCSAGANVCDCTEDKHCDPLNPKDACLGTLFCDKSSAPYKCKLNPATVVKCSGAGDTSCAKNLCDPADKKCKVTPVAEGKPCDADGSVCTVGDVCAKGVCAKGKALVCDDGNPCTNDACDAKAGCVNTANAAPCDADGNPCTVGDVCVAKSCTAGKPKPCDDGDKCTNDSCDKKTGACENAKIAGCGGNCQDGSHCDDGTTCTKDSCVKDPGQAWGKCFYSNQPGTCTDFNACTDNDHCDAGKCVGAKKQCIDGNPCTNDGCDPTKGCVYPPNAAPCDDFDKCTLADQCKAGKCTAGTKKPCDDSDKCTTDSCNPGDGGCIHKGIAGCGGFCDTAADCDDGNVCTKATCVSSKCVSQTVSGACDDGDTCTPKDSCSGGKCKPGAKKVCDDKNTCTADSCDKETGNCVHAELKEGGSCDDGSKCTAGDACAKDSKGALVCAGKPKSCDDGNACTDDKCDANTGNCQPTLNTKACEDGNTCTFGDACSNGKCVAGTGVAVDTLSGSGGIHGNKGGFADGAGDKALYSYPIGVAVNSKGVVYVGDQASNRIRRVAADGTTSTFAGQAKAGLLDGKGTAAWFNRPHGLAMAADDSFYVADRYNHGVRKVGGDGTVTTIAGDGTAGHVNGEGGKARFNQPFGLTVSQGGVVFVADTYNHRIRRIALGQVTTLSGTGSAGFTNGAGNKARFYYPTDVALDAAGNVLVVDQSNHRIRRVAADGTTTTFAGTGGYGALNGGVDKATFRNPFGIAVDAQGTVWISDRYNHRVRRIAGGAVSTWAGSGSAGLVDGKAGSARFYYPCHIAVSHTGALYVADQYTHRIRRIRNSTNACAIDGQCWSDGVSNPANGCQSCQGSQASSKWTTAANGTPCTDGDNCTAADACTAGKCVGSKKVCDDKEKCTLDSCDGSTGLCVFTPIVGCGGNCLKASDCDDKNACTDDLCSAGKCANPANSNPCDDGNSCTAGDVCSGGKCVAGISTVVGTIAGTGQAKHVDGPAKVAAFNHPRGIELDKAGELWLADGHNHRIRKIAKDGTVSTIAGVGIAGHGDGPANQALFHYPSDVAVDGKGIVLVADVSNHRIRAVDPVKKTVTTLAGAGAAFKDGPLSEARFYNPHSVAVGSQGAIYVSDCSNHRIRVIHPQGVVTTLAGSTAGFVNGKGSAAKFSCPIGVALDSTGRVVVSDYSNHAIRRVDKDGNVTTLGGTGKAGNADGPAGSSQFYHPWGITVDSADRVLVADRHNHRLRMIDTTGFATRLAGVSYGWADGDGLTKARFYYAMGIDAGPDGTLYIGDYSNHRVRKVFPSKQACAIGGACYSDGVVNPAQPCQRCDGAKSPKSWTNSGDGAACDDGNVCTTTDVCASGKCGGKATSCDDGDKCTKDACGATGLCEFTPIIGCNGYCTEDKHCDDGNPCTVGEACVNNVCAAGKDVLSTTIGGNGTAGYKDGDVAASQLNRAYDVTVNGKGEVFAVDYYNHRIRKMAGGKVSTFAGSGNQGLKSGKGDQAWFSNPAGITAATDGTLYVSDRSNHAIRKITVDGTVSTFAGNGAAGNTNGKGSAARFNQPIGIHADSAGVVWVTDYANHRIRKITADGTVTTIAGSSAGFADGKGTAAKFNGPIDVVADGKGALYVSELSNHRIRKVAADGTVTTFAGTGQAGLLNGDLKTARFYNPWGLALDSAGRLYVTSYRYHRIRVIEGGAVYPLTGSSAGFADGAAGRFYHPLGMANDAQGNLYVADWNNYRVRKVVITGGSCHIGGVCWAAGMSNPAKACEACDGSKNAKAWSAVSGCTP